MGSSEFDLVIRGGTVATAIDTFEADIGIQDGRITSISQRLGTGAREIDATGRLVLPGGVDSHCHIEQMSGAGIMNADTFESATVSAALGGTTTVIPFAAQGKGMRLRRVVDDYMALARKGAVVDYTFHMIVADPTETALQEDIPALVAEGHGSIKLFMTYDALKVDDEALLDVLLAARTSGAMVCVHAENHGMIQWMGRRLIEKGYRAAKFHAAAHPRSSEVEAINRLVACAELIDQPVMVFHVSTAEGAAAIRQARGRGLKVFAETCPQYLFLTADDLARPGNEGAKWVCSPPPRTVVDQEALWQALALGDLQTVSSDHAPYAFDETGKLRAGQDPDFKQIPNGIPGLQMRMPLLFDAMVSRGRLGLGAFVRVTATEPAKIYNLWPRKGSIAIGADADLTLWDPKREVTLSDDLVRDRSGYTPYAGRSIKGWPETVVRRGEVIVSKGQMCAAPGSGSHLPRGGGEAARPRGVRSVDTDPASLFGADVFK